MNTDTIKGTGRDFTGKVKETLGDATGDRSLQGEGFVDQVSGKVQKAVGTARETLDGKGALIDEARRFFRERPVVATTLAGVLGIALINTLRGK